MQDDFDDGMGIPDDELAGESTMGEGEGTLGLEHEDDLDGVEPEMSGRASAPRARKSSEGKPEPAAAKAAKPAAPAKKAAPARKKAVAKKKAAKAVKKTAKKAARKTAKKAAKPARKPAKKVVKKAAKKAGGKNKKAKKIGKKKR